MNTVIFTLLIAGYYVFAGIYGKNIEKMREIQLVPQCLNLTCLNGGKYFSIQHGKECGCVCEYGYEGANCQVNRTLEFLQQNLTVKATKVCENYTCLNRGKYMEIFEQDECGCICENGFNGQHCESNKTSNPPSPKFASEYQKTRIRCEDLACRNMGHFYSLNNGRECGCVCLKGYQGKHCNITTTTVITTDIQKADNLTLACFNYECLNGGVFYSIQHGRECGCICASGFDGLHCSTAAKH